MWVKARPVWLSLRSGGELAVRRGGGLGGCGSGRRWGFCGKEWRWRGMRPRFSGGQTRQAVEEHGEDRLIGGARRQVDLDLGFQLDDAGGEFDQAQPQVSNCMTRQQERAGIARRSDHMSQ